jgi:hypothetical protein
MVAKMVSSEVEKKVRRMDYNVVALMAGKKVGLKV